MLGRARPQETPLDALDQLMTTSPGLVAGVLALACIALAVALVILARRTARLDRRLQSLTRGEDGTSLEAILGSHLERVYALNADVERLTTRTTTLEQVQRTAFQRVGLVRFNPFEDTGGNQSFALALLDQNADGFIVSSLHSRNGTRIYAKAITGGRCDTAMSSEEEQALKAALATGPGAAKAG
jgi:hypothetical protein